MRAARELCDRYGVLLLIDEVKTGFRVARGGVQELYGVRADLCTFAKAMGNGYPISVLAGREDIMRKIGRGRRARRDLHGALGIARGGRADAADPRRDRCARAHRRLRHAPARRHERDPARARHRAQLRRASLHERPVLRRRSRRATTATGRAATTPSTTRWRRCCTTRACSASRTRASRGSSVRRTMSSASSDALPASRWRSTATLERPGRPASAGA